MKKFLNILSKIHKPDEMEQYIIFRAQRNAYLFLVAALLLWSFYESYQVFAYQGSLNLLPCMLLTAAVLVQTFTQLILTRNAVKDNEDSYEREPFIRIFVLILTVAGIIATITAAILLMGVQV